MPIDEYYRRQGAKYLHKFGRNPDIDQETLPEDIWEVGGVYPFPDEAKITTIVGGVNDDAGGTGAQIVEVQGLNSDGLFTAESVVMNGVNPVELDDRFFRVFRAKVLKAGSNETNEGDIYIKHDEIILAKISADLGQTLMAIYTIPVDYGYGDWVGWYLSGPKPTNMGINVVIKIRERGGAWQVKEYNPIVSQGTTFIQHCFPGGRGLPALTDIKVSVVDITANNADISAGFYIWLVK